MKTLMYTILSLSGLGLSAAIILYFIAQKFKVIEDPRIDDVDGVLPGANCGACGYPGCRGFAEALVKADDISEMFCPVGGADCMKEVATLLGKEAPQMAPMVAVLRCNGSFENAPKTTIYDSAKTCAICASFYAGDTQCAYGCLGFADCVESCKFDAMYMDISTGLPGIIEEKCTSCGACVKACPKSIIELRKKGPKSRRIFVSCINEDKGALARKACKAACIGCGLCVKECPFDAITLDNFLAYIDFDKCKLCRKCVAVCPTKCITEINFPPKKEPLKKDENKN